MFFFPPGKNRHEALVKGQAESEVLACSLGISLVLQVKEIANYLYVDKDHPSRENKADAQNRGEFLKQVSQVSKRAELSAQVEGLIKMEVQLPTRAGKQGMNHHRGRVVNKNEDG